MEFNPYYEGLLELLPAGVYFCEAPSGVIRLYNRRAVELWGRKPKAGDRDERFCASLRMYQNDGTPVNPAESPMAHVLQTGQSVRNAELVVEQPGGLRLNVLVNVHPIRDPAGTVVGAVNVFLDITERKRAEARRNVISEIIRGVVATPNLEQLLRRVHELLLTVLYAENCFVALRNWNSQTFSFPFIAVRQEFPPRHPEKCGKSSIDYLFRTGQPLLATKTRLGELMEQGEIEKAANPPACWLGVPLKTPSEMIGVLGLWHDENESAYSQADMEFLSSVGGQVALAIERKRMEEDLRNIAERVSLMTGEEFYRSVLQYLNETLEMDCALIGELTGERSNRVRTIAVCEKERITPNFEYDLEDTPCHNLIRKGPCCYSEGAYKLFPRDRTLVQMQAESYAGCPLFDSRSRPLGVLCVVARRPLMNRGRVLSLLQIFASRVSAELERQRAEETLRRSEAAMRSLVDNAPYGIYRSSNDGDRFLDVNPALVKMLGYESKSELLNLKISSDVYQNPSERRRLVEKSTVSEYFKTEAAWKRKDGKPIVVRLSGRRDRSAADPNVLFEVIAEDVTEQRTLEEQFRQAQKMEAVGRLAGGVAHDFNNLLGVILGYAELILDRPGCNEDLRRQAEQIQKAGHSAVALTRQLLAFSRKQVLEPKVVDLDALVSDTSKMLRRIIGEDVKLIAVATAGLGRVKVDPGQIEQVLMNLAVNARDAMPQGGTITVETANVTLDQAYAESHPSVKPGQYVMLAVSDTGTGIDAETRLRIFEPFFTTKKEGTGLGLATVYGIVKQSGGNIWFYSEPGLGTTFKIYFPRIEEAADSVAAVIPEKALRGTETILLVEDAEPLLGLTREYLERSGYTVLEAKNGIEALRLAEHHTGAIHLLLTDVVMPEMGGHQLADRWTQFHPETKVLYVSGYTDGAIVRHGVLEEGVSFLTKPFTQASLARKVREVLDAGGRNHAALPKKPGS